MRRFLLYVHTGRREALSALSSVLEELAAHNVTAVMAAPQIAEIRDLPKDLCPPSLCAQVDDVEVLPEGAPATGLEIAIVLGGDGTILRALETVRDSNVPTHGVNLGHVGFLAESEVEGLATTVQRLLAGDYSIEERSALDVTVRDDNDNVLSSHWALNEAALEKTHRGTMIYVAIEIDGRPVSSFGCDGVLMSTATGSTAYAFSAGGPVVWPEIDAMLVVPLAAHALFSRPLVLGRSSDVAVEVTIENPSEAGQLTFDGRRRIPISAGTRIEARLSQRSVRLARLATTPFADRLVEKFQLPVQGWRGRGTRGQGTT